MSSLSSSQPILLLRGRLGFHNIQLFYLYKWSPWKFLLTLRAPTQTHTQAYLEEWAQGKGTHYVLFPFISTLSSSFTYCPSYSLSGPYWKSLGNTGYTHFQGVPRAPLLQSTHCANNLFPVVDRVVSQSRDSTLNKANSCLCRVKTFSGGAWGWCFPLFNCKGRRENLLKHNF